MNQDRLIELAQLQAVGALPQAEQHEFQRLLELADPAAKAGLSQYFDTAALLAQHTVPQQTPSPDLKSRILRRLEQQPEETKATGAPPATVPDSLLQALLGSGSPPPLSFVKGADSEGWRDLPVPGASVKVLSVDRERGYVVALGKLLPGTRYPAHKHIHGEEVYVLTGDLSIGHHRMEAGDFHRAEPGSSHDVNWSETGCTILAVISAEDLANQFQTTTP